MKKDKILSQDLKTLLTKFEKNDVISTIEKEYATATSHSIEINLIDDNTYLNTFNVSQTEIDRTKQSISNQGFFNLVVVRPIKNRYEIVLGRNRYLATKILGLKQLSVIIHPMDDQEMLLLLLAYFRDNRDINAVGLAIICQNLSTKFGFTQETLGQLCHLSRPAITNLIRLLRLESSILDAISKGEIGYGHAKALLSLPKEQVLEIVEQIKLKNLSVRKVEQIANEIKTNAGSLENQKINEVKLKVVGNEVRIKFKSKEKLNDFVKRFPKL